MADPVDIDAELDALPTARTRPGPPCSLGVFLNDLAEQDPARHAKVMAAIDGSAPASKIAGVLSRLGWGTADQAKVLRHRHRGKVDRVGCKCPR